MWSTAGYSAIRSLCLDRTWAELVQIPIDELDRYYALPWGVAITPDKSKIFLTTAGSQSVTVIDVPRCWRPSQAASSPSSTIFPLRQTTYRPEFPSATIRAVSLLSPDGKRLYVANRLDDTISVIDTSAENVVSTIDLGGPKERRRSASR